MGLLNLLDRAVGKFFDGPEQKGAREERDERRKARARGELSETPHQESEQARADFAEALAEEVPAALAPKPRPVQSHPTEPRWDQPLSKAKSSQKVGAFCYWVARHVAEGKDKAITVDGKSYTFAKFGKSDERGGKSSPVLFVTDEDKREHQFEVCDHTILYRPEAGTSVSPSEVNESTRDKAGRALRRKTPKAERRPRTKTRVDASETDEAKIDFLSRRRPGEDIWFRQAGGEWEQGLFEKLLLDDQEGPKARIEEGPKARIFIFGYKNIPLSGAAFACKLPAEAKKEPGVVHALMSDDQINGALNRLRGKEIEVRTIGQEGWRAVGRGTARKRQWEWEINSADGSILKLSEFDIRAAKSPEVGVVSKESATTTPKGKASAPAAKLEHVDVPSDVISVDLSDDEIKARMHRIKTGDRVEIQSRGKGKGATIQTVHRIICHDPDPKKWIVTVSEGRREAKYHLAEFDIKVGVNEPKPAPVVEKPLEAPPKAPVASTSSWGRGSVTHGRTSRYGSSLDLMEPQHRPVELGWQRLEPSTETSIGALLRYNMGKTVKLWFGTAERPREGKIVFVGNEAGVGGGYVATQEEEGGFRTETSINGITEMHVQDDASSVAMQEQKVAPGLQQTYAHLEPGDQVIVTFRNGKRTEGMVTNKYPFGGKQFLSVGGGQSVGLDEIADITRVKSEWEDLGTGPDTFERVLAIGDEVSVNLRQGGPAIKGKIRSIHSDRDPGDFGLRNDNGGYVEIDFEDAVRIRRRQTTKLDMNANEIRNFADGLVKGDMIEMRFKDGSVVIATYSSTNRAFIRADTWAEGVMFFIEEIASIRKKETEEGASGQAAQPVAEAEQSEAVDPEVMRVYHTLEEGDIVSFVTNYGTGRAQAGTVTGVCNFGHGPVLKLDYEDRGTGSLQIKDFVSLEITGRSDRE